MKRSITSQEILLFTGTSFSKNEFCSGDPFNYKSATHSLTGELEQACWSGMIGELLPELSTSIPNIKMFIWNVLSAEHFILISQGTDPQPVSTATSVDPHVFLLSFHQN